MRSDYCKAANASTEQHTRAAVIDSLVPESDRQDLFNLSTQQRATGYALAVFVQQDQDIRQLEIPLPESLWVLQEFVYPDQQSA